MELLLRRWVLKNPTQSVKSDQFSTSLTDVEY